MEQRIEVKGLDVIDVVKYIRKKNKWYIAVTMRELEHLVDDPETFKDIRKLFLDNFNEYTRSVLRTFFGDEIEGLFFIG